MRVDKVEPEDRSRGQVSVTLSDDGAPGLFATAQVQHHEGRLAVVQVWIGQDPISGVDRATEVTSAAMRVFAPQKIIQALAEWTANPFGIHPELPNQPGLTEIREWFRSVGSESGVALVDQTEHALAVTQGVEPPKRAGRPPKFTDDELRRWALRALEVEAEHPASRHQALADAMSASGDVKVAHSTSSDARDLIKRLRRRRFLLPASKSGARDPWAAGPQLTPKEQA